MPGEIEIVENGNQNGKPEVEEQDDGQNGAQREHNGTQNNQNGSENDQNGSENDQNCSEIDQNGSQIDQNGSQNDHTGSQNDQTDSQNDRIDQTVETEHSNPQIEVTIVETAAEPEDVESEEHEPKPEPVRIVEVEKVPEIIQSSPVVAQNGSSGPKKVSMTTSLDTDAVKAAYEDVRSDNSNTQWAVFKFEGSRIVCSAKGAEFDRFREQFTDNDRAFGYIRIQTGDEMSKRQKFLFITWVGPSVSVIQRAKMSTDKSVMKNIISNFAVELQLENDSEFDFKHFVQELNKAGGANYGTGIRDN